MKDTGIYMENETLGNFARNTASMLEPDGTVSGRAVAARTMAVLRSLKAKVDMAGSGDTGGEAGEWFRDNWYLAEREGKDAAAHLRSAGRLPRAAGETRSVVSEAASALLRSGRGQVTGERIRLFLDEYQKARVLTQRELSVFVPALKAELCALLDETWPDGAGPEEQAALLGNIFTSLRLLGSMDVSDILEDVNRIERMLKDDPAGVYALMDEETRAMYRSELSRLAKKAGMSEAEAAKKALELARADGGGHVGTYILQKPLGAEKRAPTGGWYIGTNVVATAFFTVLTGIVTGSLFAAVLAVLPVSEIVKNVVDFVCLRLTRPGRLARMELRGGIPRSARTVCVISALLTKPEDGARYASLLEEYRLLNRDAGENLLFGILADLPEAETQRSRDDGRILEGAKRAVDELNARYSGGFYLLVRDRELSKADNIWMGRERKRGAIEDLVKLLSGEKSALRVLSGDGKALAGAAFILTLDADTRLTAGSARELLGAALHPLNVPVIDERLGRVTSGYGVFEPRISVDLKSAGRSDFSKIFAGEGGVDPYSSAVSDLYQDLFGEGTFMGKGLINVPVYKRLLDGAMPDNAVLSHDILEGAYLRCAFVSDTELTDGWPYKVTSYFARQERWTRGDWQNIRWCTGYTRRRDGSLTKNTLTSLTRWKLIDNLRRSLLPVGMFAAIFAGMLGHSAALTAAAVIGAASAVSGLLLSSAELIVRHDGSTRLRFQSAIISGLAGAIMRSAIRLMLLPAEAWIQLRAAATAVWRMAVSHKRMLAWVTSSDAERRHGNTLAVNYRALLACPIAGALALFLSGNAIAGAAGVVWIFAPAYAWRLSRENKSGRGVSQAARSYLLARAGEIWRYFEENLTEEDNFLPPDNVQVEPNIGKARRTSPTNIGLAVLSCIAASDLGLIGEAEAVERVKRTLGTVEKLERWRGHLYNWYDTGTLAPMEPRYVSTVDSGNLMGALIAARQWLLKEGEPEAAETCEKIVKETDLKALYDEKRRLFCIGWDMTKNAPTPGWYDLLASEARETSFIAVALGAAPRKHWRALGRALVSQDSYCGMASWTGTMFEYLMPNLLLPCQEDSLLYESSRFCLYAQKRAHGGIPWGISESAYYAFDPSLSYRYKAHGVQRLALKRGMGTERVVSPYSTYLALTLDPRGAVRNLKRLATLGMEGKYGLYEAADFTPSRVGAGRCEPVRTYMAHHLGMSLVAIANALCGDVFPRRFMADRRMGAFRELLEERIPTGRLVLRQPPRDVPSVPRRAESSGYSESFSEIDAVEPRCAAISNGGYTAVFAETGAVRSRCRGLEVTRFEPEAGGRPGVAMYLVTPEGTIPLTAAPEFDPDVRYEAQLTDLYGRISAKKGGYRASVTLTVPPATDGERRCVEISAPAGVGEVTVIMRFEPVLEERRDFDSHPAFSKLALEAELSGGVLTVRRRPKPGKEEAFLAAAASPEAAFATASRRGDQPGEGFFAEKTPDMAVTVCVPVKLTAGRGRAELAIAVARDREEARQAARGMLEAPDTQSVSRVSAAALMLGMGESDVRAAMGMISPLIYGGVSSDKRKKLRESGRFSKEALWAFGISGDLPMIAARVENDGQIKGAEDLVRRHAFLAENGVRADLALLLTDGGDYRASQRRAVTELLRSLGRDFTLGAPGGVHLLDDHRENSGCVEALSDVFVRLDAVPAAPGHRGRAPERPTGYIRGSRGPEWRVEPDGTFRLGLRDVLPEAAWSHILANRDFGYLATECGTGYMWYKNSRLMKLTPAPGDPMAVTGPERVELKMRGGRRSLFADGSGDATLTEYGFGWARWERELGGVRSRLTAFVPPELAARVMVLELNGAWEGAEIEYNCRLTMSEGAGDRILTRLEDGCLTAENTSGPFKNTIFHLAADRPMSAYTTEGRDLETAEPEGYLGAPDRAVFRARFNAAPRLVLVTGCADTASLKNAARDAGRLFEETKKYWRGIVDRVTAGRDAGLVGPYMSGWAVYQTYACRMLAKTALYQNGGATGFRDQLQDACALLTVDPEITRGQIIYAAGHQFIEGDVAHWWHQTPEGDLGVRTRCSDDLMWLPWAVADYVNRTGDMGILSASAPYLAGRELQDGERDRYERLAVSAESGTVMDHALRAARCFMGRGVGEHGLALILSGDWNDGFDGVGREGRGESVWLSFFGSMTLTALAELCDKTGLEGESRELRKFSGELLRAAEGAWTGRWYLRGWYDDGRPLGAPGDGECEIDSIAQSFAVFAGADRMRARQAVVEAYERLFDPASRTAKLFDPPFDRGDTKPGYIKTYAPGFRENGGQYTHAAVWLAMALMKAGERERGERLLRALSPFGRDPERYAVEPYVLAGDVYAGGDNQGRGGWTWYTGSAGWYLRAVTECLYPDEAAATI